VGVGLVDILDLRLCRVNFELCCYCWFWISLLSASPVGEARLPMPKGMAYKD
jgi:hypothetical protein